MPRPTFFVHPPSLPPSSLQKLYGFASAWGNGRIAAAALSGKNHSRRPPRGPMMWLSPVILGAVGTGQDRFLSVAMPPHPPALSHEGERGPGGEGSKAALARP